MIIYSLAYCVGAISTFGVIYNAHKAVGTPYFYAVVSSVFWPIWWFLYTIGDVH